MTKIGVVDLIFVVIPMLFIAMILDFINFLILIAYLFGIGIVGSWIIDLIGALTIGIFMFILNKSTVGLEKGLWPILSKILPRLGLAFLIEFIPIAGDICPSWTILVCVELYNLIMS
jgi:hypothetical protein